MASYQPQVLDAPPSALDYVSSGIGKFNDLYTSAAMKKAFTKKEDEEKKKKQEQLLKELIQLVGKDNLKAKLGPDGMSYETKDTPDFKENDFSLAALGSPRAMRRVADEFGINQKTAADNPLAGMSLASGGVGDIAGNELQGEPNEEYAKRIMEFAQGTPKVQEVVTEKNVAQEIKALADNSGDDAVMFVKGLKALSMKYANNKKALDLIEKNIKINTEDEGSEYSKRQAEFLDEE